MAAFPIPEVIRGINAFTQGVREVNPEAEVRVVWTSTWFGPPKEKEAADALLAQGADVIAQHQDTTEPQKAAPDAGAVSIGYDCDMRTVRRRHRPHQPGLELGPKYIEIVKAIQDGTYAERVLLRPLKDGIFDLAPLSPLVGRSDRAIGRAAQAGADRRQVQRLLRPAR